MSDLTKLSVKNLKLKLKLLKLPVSGKKSVLIERLLLSGRYNPDNDDILTAVLSGKSQSVPGKRKAKRKTKFKMNSSLQDGKNIIVVEVPWNASEMGKITEHGHVGQKGVKETSSYHFLQPTTTYKPGVASADYPREIKKGELIHIQTYVKKGNKAYVTVERDPSSGQVTQIFDESTVDGKRQIGWGILKKTAPMAPRSYKNMAWIDANFKTVEGKGPIYRYRDAIINQLNRYNRETGEGSTQAMNRRAEYEQKIADMFGTQINVFDLGEDDTIQVFVRIGSTPPKTEPVNVLRIGENYEELVPKRHFTITPDDIIQQLNYREE